MPRAPDVIVSDIVVITRYKNRHGTKIEFVTGQTVSVVIPKVDRTATDQKSLPGFDASNTRFVVRSATKPDQ